MLKNLSNLGSVLNKAEQLSVNGGFNCPTPITQAACESIGGYWDDFECIYDPEYCH